MSHSSRERDPVSLNPMSFSLQERFHCKAMTKKTPDTTKEFKL